MKNVSWSIELTILPRRRGVHHSQLFGSQRDVSPQISWTRDRDNKVKLQPPLRQVPQYMYTLHPKWQC